METRCLQCIMCMCIKMMQRAVQALFMVMETRCRQRMYMRTDKVELQCDIIEIMQGAIQALCHGNSVSAPYVYAE